MAAHLSRAARFVGALAAAAVLLTACTGGGGDREFGLSREGRLSVCVPVPTPLYAQSGEGDTMSGLDADVLAAIGEKIGLIPYYVVIPRDWLGTDRPFTEGRCQIVAGGRIVDTAARDVIDYTYPYLRTHAAMLVRADSSATGPADLGDDARVATPGERPWAKIVAAYAERWGVTRETAPDLVAAVAALDAGDVTAVLADAASLRYLAKTEPERYRLVEGVDQPAFPVAFATSVFVETDLRDALNGAIRELDTGGVLAETRRDWTGV